MAEPDQPRGEQAKDAADPTADWLADIRPGEIPWRVDRPVPDEQTAPRVAGEPAETGDSGKWRKARAVARAAGQAAPYVQAGAVAGWAATAAFGADETDETGWDVPDLGSGIEG